MYKHCSTEESARRQRQFEQALLELMLQQNYSQITISDLCTALELSRKSFYRYFGSKDDCLAALIDHSILDFTSRLPEGVSLRSGKVLEHFFLYWQQLSSLLEALYRNDLISQLLERMILCTTQERDLEPLLRPLEDQQELIVFLISGITGVLLTWHLSGYEKSAAQIAASLHNLSAQALEQPR